jgi:hypothetical protein
MKGIASLRDEEAFARDHNASWIKFCERHSLHAGLQDLIISADRDYPPILWHAARLLLLGFVPAEPTFLGDWQVLAF